MTLTLNAHVRGGRLVLDEPVDLPEGTEVALVPADDGDQLDPAERARLHAALERAQRQLTDGEAIASQDVLNGLRTARCTRSQFSLRLWLERRFKTSARGG